MINSDEGNLLNDQKIALDWIKTVEGDKGRIRDGDIYPRLKTWVNSVSTIEILEIGAGQGICSDKIDLAGRNYTGLEHSPLLVDRAKQQYCYANRRFVLGSAYQLPFSEGVFDAAFSIAVWHLLDDLKKTASELSRVLKADGQFLIVTANPSAYTLWTEMYTDTKSDGRRFEGNMRLQDNSLVRETLYLHPLDEMKNSFSGANLRVTAMDTFRRSDKTNGMDLFISIQGQKVL